MRPVGFGFASGATAPDNSWPDSYRDDPGGYIRSKAGLDGFIDGPVLAVGDAGFGSGACTALVDP